MLLFSLGFLTGLATIPVAVIVLGVMGVRYLP